VATTLTAIRLLLVLPVALACAQPGFLAPRVLFALLLVAVATDYGDGKVARMTGTASPRGQLFDHGTDFVFVTAGLTGAAMTGIVTPILPLLITAAFSQYVLDSYFLHRQKQLRMSVLGRWNGVLYFVPLFLISASRLSALESVASSLAATATTVCYGLAMSTIVSVIDRAVAPLRKGHPGDTALQNESARNDRH
jgi:phosphatidylglycerophosphate synthase